MQIFSCYKFGQDGFLLGEAIGQEDKFGSKLLPPNSTELAPSFDLQKNFAQWTGDTWKAVPKPTSAGECVGIVISHESNEPYAMEMRELFTAFTDNSQEYRIVRGQDLSWSVEKIPEPDKDLVQAEQAMSDFDTKVEQLKERMATAQLLGDQDSIQAIQAEYLKLMME